MHLSCHYKIKSDRHTARYLKNTQAFSLF